MGVFDGTFTNSLCRASWEKNDLAGHIGTYVSEYAARDLLKELDGRISAEMTKNPSVLDDAIPACLIDTMPWHEGTLDDVPRFLGMKEMGEHDPYDDLSRHEAVRCWIDRFSCRHYV